ncbi:phospholipase [Curtobacterium sp. VKM Ac-2922]|uniref:aggregation-promoting factor C-terminal-like domain-containing protein n=1 Tax=Curtobacterium sp. VKM Ac-2922 TaxID=2929475 RepID=UPI001FB25F0A|nr:phospholipase [Curtobacterium sp. VKM Ac-2922]MCJ1714782.1 phospholipase [Curtobacterium sp. VKM Ac-2922]
MSAPHPHSPTSPTTRRAALDSPSRRIRRTLRKRGVLLASGAAVLVVAGGALTVGTQPAIGEAIGIPTSSATAAPALSGTALDRAQAAATISTAKTVVADANDKTDTRSLERRIASLSDYQRLSGAAISDRIQTTVDTAQDVAQASADQDKQDADAAAAAARAAEAAAKAKADADAAAAAAAQAAAAQAAANTPAGAKATAAALASSQYGWGADQFQCLNSLWTKESGWDYQAYNPSGATGIPQALPGSKMATIASDWQTNATTQVTWGLKYIKDAYGSPCAAWSHSQATNYY